MNITFLQPEFLWLLIAIPLFMFAQVHSLKYTKQRAMRLANFEALERVLGKVKVSTRVPFVILRMTVLLLLIFGASGLVFWYTGITQDSAYVIALDASGSMLATDIAPNRLEAAKQSAISFVEETSGVGQIAVVSFSGVEEVEVPLSSDKEEVKDAISNIQIHSLHGTALSTAIATSLNLLQQQDKARTIILLTDGQENVAPQEQLRQIVHLAKNRQVTIHTISVGTVAGGEVPGLALISQTNTEVLNFIAEETEGTFSEVGSPEELRQRFNALATSSESQIPVQLRVPFLVLAILLLFFEWTVLNTILRFVP